MPVLNNINALLGAAFLGVISAAGLFLVECYRNERNRLAMVKDLARLDNELSTVKKELDHLLAKKKPQNRRTRALSKASSVKSNSTDEYLSASNFDSSDLEYYDLSDNEVVQSNHSTDLETVLSKLDKKLNSTMPEMEEVLQRLQELCTEYPKNPELFRRIGRVHYNIADKSRDPEFIQIHVEQGLEACDCAMELKSDSEIHKLYALLVSTRHDFVPQQQKVNDAHLIKKHVEEGLTLNPEDPLLHYMLGRLEYEVASLKWYERRLVTLMGLELPTASLEEALTHLLEAERLADFEWMENKMMIAKCKIIKGDYKEAIQWLDRASNCRQGDSMDTEADLELKDLLEKYKSYR